MMYSVWNTAVASIRFRHAIGAEEYLSRINIKVYEGDENGNLVFEGGAAECLAWADGYCGHC